MTRGSDESAGATGSPPVNGSPRPASVPSPGTAREVFGAFLRLGLTSFGGPVAHLGYFRAELVARRGWLGDGAYADLVALSQLLPGPGSSKVGMGIGLHRAGMRGLLAAWAGFTLPSALALFAFAMGVGTLGDLTDAGWVTGLKVAAVAVVAHAVLGMARTLTPDLPRAVIGVLALALALAVPGPFAQVGAIVGAALVGLIVLRRIAIDPRAGEPLAVRVSRPVTLTAAGVLIVLLVLLPVLA